MKAITLIATILLVQCFVSNSSAGEQVQQYVDSEQSESSEKLTGSIVQDLMEELKLKKVNIKRWGTISDYFGKLKVGMLQKEVERLLGKRDVYPKDQSIWQYSPSEFRGGANGPDWNLIIHMKNGRVSGFRLLKYVYGPPPG